MHFTIMYEYEGTPQANSSVYVVLRSRSSTRRKQRLICSGVRRSMSREDAAKEVQKIFCNIFERQLEKLHLPGLCQPQIHPACCPTMERQQTF